VSRTIFALMALAKRSWQSTYSPDRPAPSSSEGRLSRSQKREAGLDGVYDLSPREDDRYVVDQVYRVMEHARGDQVDKASASETICSK
jgi:hypothetical protein